MLDSTKDGNPSATAKLPMQAASGPRTSHKRNLSNGTSGNSPLRRSKRQRSTVNLKEASSSDETETKVAAKSPPKKAARTKTRRTSVKKEQVHDTELVSSAEIQQKDLIKSEEEDFTVEAEDEAEVEAETAIQKKPARKRRKTKEEKEAEAMPLAARTQGLKMFVGAHVSAAKGILPRSFRLVQS